MFSPLKRGFGRPFFKTRGWQGAGFGGSSVEREGAAPAPWGPGGARTLWVEAPGHQTLQLHGGGVILGCIGGVGGDSSPASESGLGGLRHPQPHRFLGGARETRQEREASYFCDKDSKVEKQTYLSVRALEQLVLSFA